MYRSVNQIPIAPSAVPISGSAASAFHPPKEMSLEDIQEAKEKFVTAGVLAK